jgi:trimethylamine--corrinoid protein Co-methyltransferase
MKSGRLRYLTQEDVQRIHYASLEVLRKVGLKSKSKRILEIFRRGGAEVKGEIVRIPEHLVHDAVRNAPKQILLCGRNSKHDILLEHGRIYFGMGGSPPPFIRDLESGEFRRPTKRDFAESTRLGDALPNMSFIMSVAGAFDVPYQVEYEHEWEALFNNTEKPIVYCAPGAYSARKVLEMGGTVVGGMEELRKRPIMCLYTETSSPLTIPEVCENAVEFAEFGVPVTQGSSPLVGATAPGTLAGTMVVSNAENLATVVLVQLVRRGAPFIYGGFCDVMDPMTGRMSYGCPEFAISTSVLNGQMAEYYGLPVYGFAAPSDSKLPDAQAGAEAMQMSLMNALAGINLMHDCGYLAGGSAGSMEMVVICNEVFDNVLRIVRGVDVNDETLAVDVIKEIGPEGSFLAHKHTLKHIRNELHIPALFDRRPEAEWAKMGRKATHQVAQERARQILKEHFPEPLPKDVQERLSLLVKEAERERVTK